MAFAFHAYGLDTLLFTDTDGYNITELAINKNITLIVKDIREPDVVNITAYNPFNNFSFLIEMKYIDEDEELREEIMWIVILSISAVMIISLIIVFIKQRLDAGKKKKSIKFGNQ